MGFKAYPIKVKPIYKERVWGGRKLKSMLPLPARKKIGEAWFFADEGADHSVISNGIFKGQKISDIMRRYGREMLGEKYFAKYGKRFPLLLKLLDSEEKLSVQVHPGDSYAGEREAAWGKTEAWYIVKARKGAKVLVGLKKKSSTKREIKKAILDGTIGGKLNAYSVKEGDFYYIPSGTFHAIAGGSIIFEIQQNSDITYRVYDWNRVFDGVPRKLHIADALDVFRHDKQCGKQGLGCAKENGSRLLIQCPYFTARHVAHNGGTRYIAVQGQPFVLTVIKGTAELALEGGEKTALDCYESAFIPAMTGMVEIRATKNTSYIITEVR
jgi:mannose-6-phosphate isomerase